MEYNVTLSWNCLPSHRRESFGFIPEIVLDSFWKDILMIFVIKSSPSLSRICYGDKLSPSLFQG